MSMSDYDVVICGAGPGGIMAALMLAQANKKVAIVDKAHFPRDKVCGDALSGKVVSVLKYGYPSAVEQLYDFSEKLGSWGIRFFAPNAEYLDIPFKMSQHPSIQNPPGFISKRLDFDFFLFKLMSNFDQIHTVQNYQVQEANCSEQEIEISDGKQSIRGRILIGADGAQSVVKKQLQGSQIDKKHHSAGIRAYYTGVSGFHKDHFIELHYVKDLLPGYFWIFPLPHGSANVGLGMLTHDVKKHQVNLRKRLLEIVETHPAIAPRFKEAQLIGNISGFGLPLGSKRRKISGSGYMLVGDAASLIDPFTGEGIGNAMLSGKIAGEYAIKALESNDSSAAFFSAYDQAVYKKMGKELALSHRLQQLVNFPWLFNFVVRKANRNPSMQKMMTMMFDDMDIRKELSKASFYWKLLWG